MSGRGENNEDEPEIRIIKNDLVFKGWSRCYRAQYDQRRRDGEIQRVNWEYRDNGSAAAVLPYNPVENTVVLIRQFRFPAYVAGHHGRLWECCAGIIDTGETPENCARREILEEAGYEALRLISHGHCFSSPGALTEQLYLFIAEIGPARPGAGGGLAHEGEDIEVVEMPFEAAMALIGRGEIVDMKTLLLLHILQGAYHS